MRARIAGLATAAVIVALLPNGCARSAASPAAAPAQRPLPARYAGPATRADITAGDLMTRLYKYADDSLMGRYAGTEWNDRATAYIESELRRLGLQPGGENGSYFQYPLVSRVIDSTVAVLEVDGTRFDLWRDVAPRDQGNGTRSFDGAQVVYGGNLGDPATLISNNAAAG
ncbi:MAG TPA: hypothetical protein VHM67_03090, partial [Gemmatimonadaceae bacterium]|nr:hypothetical protein [Gemmatimonadaceae bacterium]